MKPTANRSAILRGEQRSTRYKYRHTLAGAAHELGIPLGWVWFWYLEERLPSQSWLRRIWIRLEDVQQLFADQKAVYDAFYATGEALEASQAIRWALERWPDFPKQMYLVEQPANVVPIRAQAKKAASKPVTDEERVG